MSDSLIFLNALNRISFLGPVRIGALIRHCGTARSAWSAQAAKLEQIPELQGLVNRLLEERRLIDPEAQWRRLQSLKVSCLTLDCPEYPTLLKQISHPPPLLYYRGRWVDEPAAVAVVGSRRCTVYGREAARRLAGELALAGLTVISGLALGVDTAAHQGALAADGRTVAVLGCGLDRCYPPSNTGLMKAISGCGAVLSEFPLDTLPLPQHFPQRNRIISGLSLGTVVVEATAKSGALITANYALEQNREVFAVPGPVDSPYSRGCHRLLKEGARLVESCADILEEFQMIPSAAAAAAAGSESSCTVDEENLLNLIPYQPLHMDELIRLSGFTAEQISALLLGLELKGLIRQLPGKYFSRQ
jgi:DNA processing protein